MAFLDHRIRRQRVEDRMGKSAVVIRSAVLCEEDRRNSRGDNDGEDHLLHIVGAETFLMILKCFHPILKQRFPAHLTDRDPHCRKMLQTLVPGRDHRLIIFCVSITDSRPHISLRGFRGDLRVDERVHRRPDKEMRL